MQHYQVDFFVTCYRYNNQQKISNGRSIPLVSLGSKWRAPGEDRTHDLMVTLWRASRETHDLMVTLTVNSHALYHWATGAIAAGTLEASQICSNIKLYNKFTSRLHQINYSTHTHNLEIFKPIDFINQISVKLPEIHQTLMKVEGYNFVIITSYSFVLYWCNYDIVVKADWWFLLEES